MSRGPGNVERKIAKIFASNPDKWFAAGTLCEMIWPGANRIEHKHRVSVIRAASKIAEKTKWTKTSLPAWTSFKGIVLFIGPKATEMLEELAEANKWKLPSEQEVQGAIRLGVHEALYPPKGALLSPSTKTLARLLVCSPSTIKRDVRKREQAELIVAPDTT
jgi:hypothetical protein